MRRWLVACAVSLASLAVAGCRPGSGEVPADRSTAPSATAVAPSQSYAVRIDAELSGSGLEPSTFTVRLGDRVRLAIESQADGYLHVEGYGAAVVEVASNESSVLELTATEAGRFPIVLHGDGDEEVGTLIVED